MPMSKAIRTTPMSVWRWKNWLSFPPRYGFSVSTRVLPSATRNGRNRPDIPGRLDRQASRRVRLIGAQRLAQSAGQSVAPARIVWLCRTRAPDCAMPDGIAFDTRDDVHMQLPNDVTECPDIEFVAWCGRPQHFGHK